MLVEHEIQIRVRYDETDAMARVYHANYINYFELGRTELLRASGRTYRQLETAGLLLVVTEVSCRFHQGAEYDDLLTLRTTTTRVRGARVEHAYRLTRDDELLAEGHTVLACVGRNGKARRAPSWMRLE